MKRPVATAAALLPAVLLVAACANQAATPPATPAPKSTLTRAARFYSQLATGQTTAQVLDLFGAPDQKKPFSAAGITGEIWSYEMNATIEVHQFPVSTVDIPAINPFTGQATVRKEPVYQDQATRVVDQLHLLIIDGRLAQWSTTRKEDRDYK